MTVQGSFREWLLKMSPPPLKLPQAQPAQTTEQWIKQQQMTDRQVIDPRKINQFIDPEKEGNA
jgi:hypothetical protein